MKILLLIIAATSLLGCSGENPKQREAYDAAYRTEQKLALTGGAAGMVIIPQYQKVIAIDPSSDLAKDAQKRIDVATKNWNDYRMRQQQSIDAMNNSLLNSQ